MADVSEHATNRNPGRLTSTEMARYCKGKPAQNSACGVSGVFPMGAVQLLNLIIALASTIRKTTERLWIMERPVGVVCRQRGHVSLQDIIFVFSILTNLCSLLGSAPFRFDVSQKKGKRLKEDLRGNRACDSKMGRWCWKTLYHMPALN